MQEESSAGVTATGTTGNPGSAKRIRWFVAYAVLLCLIFIKPLVLLAQYAAGTEMYSHILLIPFVSGYLAWQLRKPPLPAISASPALAAIPGALGLVALNAFFLLSHRGSLTEPSDWLAITISAWLCFLWAGALLFLGGRCLRHFAFPAAFLVFMIPMPAFLLDWIEVFLQHASADAAALLFAIAGTPVYRDSLVFRLPGLVIQVAQECSGVRSTYVLFITSFVAAYWFLRSRGARVVLVLSVLPLAILRNGFRITTIALLTVHVDPRVINSPLHHNGGPIFFALSLIPFCAILWLLRQWEARRQTASCPKSNRPPSGDADTARRPSMEPSPPRPK